MRLDASDVFAFKVHTRTILTFSKNDRSTKKTEKSDANIKRVI